VLSHPSVFCCQFTVILQQWMTIGTLCGRPQRGEAAQIAGNAQEYWLIVPEYWLRSRDLGRPEHDPVPTRAFSRPRPTPAYFMNLS
jgi:hypothetical protein